MKIHKKHDAEFFIRHRVFCILNAFSHFAVFGGRHIGYCSEGSYERRKRTEANLISNIDQRNPLHNKDLTFCNSSLHNIFGYGRIEIFFE